MRQTIACLDLSGVMLYTRGPLLSRGCALNDTAGAVCETKPFLGRPGGCAARACSRHDWRRPVTFNLGSSAVRGCVREHGANARQGVPLCCVRVATIIGEAALGPFPSSLSRLRIHVSGCGCAKVLGAIQSASREEIHGVSKKRG